MPTANRIEPELSPEKNNWSARWDCVVYADDWSVKEVSVPQGYTVTYQQDGMVFTVCNTETLI